MREGEDARGWKSQRLAGLLDQLLVVDVREDFVCVDNEADDIRELPLLLKRESALCRELHDARQGAPSLFLGCRGGGLKQKYWRAFLVEHASVPLAVYHPHQPTPRVRVFC